MTHREDGSVRGYRSNTLMAPGHDPVTMAGGYEFLPVTTG